MDKKKHALTNNLITGIDKYIYYLSETFPGSVHEMTILEEEKLLFPDGINLYQDLGYQGHIPDNINIFQPLKKPRDLELSEEDKEINRTIAAIRIKVEHAIRDVKIFRIVKEIIRNWSYGFKDKVMEICCGLSNFKIRPHKI